MKIIFRGEEIDLADEAALLDACERHARAQYEPLNKTQRLKLLNAQLIVGSYLSLKLGALAALAEAGHNKLHLGLLYELADFAGQAQGQNFGFVTRALARGKEVFDEADRLSAADPGASDAGGPEGVPAGVRCGERDFEVAANDRSPVAR